MDRDKRLQYDSQSAALVGRSVLEVSYWDLASYGDEEPDWDYGDWHHAIWVSSW